MNNLIQPARPFPVSYFFRRMTAQDAASRKFQSRFWWALLILPAVVMVFHVAPQVFGIGDGFR